MTDEKRLQDQMQAGKFAHTDPHRGTCDDCGARLTVPNILVSTRPGFTGRDESDETAPEAHGDTPEPSAGAESVRTFVDDDGDGEPTLWFDVGAGDFAVPVVRRCDLTPQGRHLWPLVPQGELDRLQANANRDADEWVKCEGERDRARGTAVALEQEVARLTEDHEAWQAQTQRVEDLQHRLTKAEKRAEQESRTASNACERVIHLRVRAEELEQEVARLDSGRDYWRQRYFEEVGRLAQERDEANHEVEAAEARVADLERQNGLLLAQAEEHWSHRQQSEARVADLEADNARLTEQVEHLLAVDESRGRELDAERARVADLEAEVERWTEKAQEAGKAYADVNSRHHEEWERANRLERLANTLAERAVDLEDGKRAAESRARRAEDALQRILENFGGDPIRLLGPYHRAAIFREARRALSAAGQTSDATPSDTTDTLTIDPKRLTWDQRIPTAHEFGTWVESLPAGEFATGLLIIADALRERENTTPSDTTTQED